jgi:hypothetical protein
MPWSLAFSEGVIITGVSPQSAMDTKLSVKSGVCNMNKTSQTRQSFPFFD